MINLLPIFINMTDFDASDDINKHFAAIYRKSVMMLDNANVAVYVPKFKRAILNNSTFACFIRKIGFPEYGTIMYLESKPGPEWINLYDLYLFV